MPISDWVLSRRGLIAGAAAVLSPEVAVSAGAGAPVDPGESVRAALKDARGTKLVILGSAGGPIPKPTRHMTSHVMLSEGAAYVLDCGLGVTDQLARTGIPFSAVRSIFITHHHPDHNIEFGPFLVIGWISGLPLTVRAYGPPPLAEMARGFLTAWRQTVDFWAEDFKLPPLHEIEVHEVTGAGPVMRDERVAVSSVVVNHPPVTPAFGYRFDFADRSIAFSGDTTPLEAVAAMARGADVLVHEALLLAEDEKSIRATLAHGVRGDFTSFVAHTKADHSPVEEVGRIAQEAGVKTLVLSHLVPGNASISDEEWRAPAARHFHGEIIVARDLMVI